MAEKHSGSVAGPRDTNKDRERAPKGSTREPREEHKLSPRKAKSGGNQAQRLGDIMTREVEIVGPSTTLEQAAQKMDALQVGMLPVCEGDRLVGVITDRDIAIRGVAEARDAKVTSVHDIMTPDVVYGFEDDDVVQAARLMEEHQVRRLVVLDSEHRLVGVLSVDDIATAPKDEKLAGIVLRRVSK